MSWAERPFCFVEWILRYGEPGMTEKEITKLLKSRFADVRTLMDKLSLTSSEQEEALVAVLERMMQEGIVGKHDKSYYLLEDQHILLAKVTSKARNFVLMRTIPDSYECKISGREADGLLVGDLVYIKEFQEGIFHCLDYLKAVDTLKGYYGVGRDGREQLTVTYLNDCGKTVLVNAKKEGIENLRPGDLCLGKIVNVNRDFIYCDLAKVLVRADDVGSDISSIIAMNDAPMEFDEKVLAEAKSIPSSVRPEEVEGRTDFRNHVVVTIDGDDAHDFDDAVEGKKVLNGYEITVHIADVTHYVRPNHPLDDEARTRGTSIYVADRVVPMLPFELSNGICSLNPDVDRLTLSVTMQVDALGHVFSSKVERGVIRSAGRLTYKKVNEFFETKQSEYPKAIQEMLLVLKECADKVRRRRHLQGAMELESTELKFHLDEKGNPVEVSKQVSGESEKMIEDLMILANCEVARLLRKNKIPVLYRVHEFPPMSKLSVFRDYIKKMGLLSSFPKTNDITASRLNDFLAGIKNEDLRSSVSYMMLRSMAKARYSPEEIGHFGLAEIDYCHFTSPIRRYPDDIIHRLVKDYLIDGKSFDYNDVYSYLEGMGETLSGLEVRADQIERDVDDLEASKYMQAHIGETYSAKVVSMLRRGMFVQTDIGIEGFLAYHCMHGDTFHYDERSFAVLGKRTDISFTVGTRLDVTVLASNPEEREIDFATPEFYNKYALDLSDEDRERLSLDGIRVISDDEVAPMTGKGIEFRTNKPRFTKKDGDRFHWDGEDRKGFGRKERKPEEEEHYVDPSRGGFTFTKKEEKPRDERRFDRRKDDHRKERKTPSYQGYKSFKKKDESFRKGEKNTGERKNFHRGEEHRDFNRRPHDGKRFERRDGERRPFDKKPYGHRDGEKRSYGRKPTGERRGGESRRPRRGSSSYRGKKFGNSR